MAGRGSQREGAALRNDSYDVRGKHWLLPCGRVVDVTLSEHALYARGKMLNIPEDQIAQKISMRDLFRRLTPDEALCALVSGADKDCVEYLEETFETSMILPSSTVDPRVYAIRQWNWIRTRKNAFYARDWCTENQKRVLLSKEFWLKQPAATDDSWLVLYDLDGHEITGTRAALKKNIEGA